MAKRKVYRDSIGVRLSSPLFDIGKLKRCSSWVPGQARPGDSAPYSPLFILDGKTQFVGTLAAGAEDAVEDDFFGFPEESHGHGEGKQDQENQDKRAELNQITKQFTQPKRDHLQDVLCGGGKKMQQKIERREKEDD